MWFHHECALHPQGAEKDKHRLNLPKTFSLAPASYLCMHARIVQCLPSQIQAMTTWVSV